MLALLSFACKEKGGIKMQKKKGISLIVLVITIIVMIVLAGVIILSLNNSGIIGKANQAVSDTDEVTVKELAQMSWAEAYADGVRKVEGENGFQKRVMGALTTNEVDTSKYLLNITEKGVTVKLKTKAWIQDGLTVKKGNDILNIGQTINYNATGTDYEGKAWKVLGADVDGNLLIMSEEDVKKEHALVSGSREERQEDWLKAVEKLNNECKVYGKGKGALQARSIVVEDINSVTKYVPEKVVYGKERVFQYGNVVTYKFNKTSQPYYVGENGLSGTLTQDHSSGFYYFNGSNFKYISLSELKQEQNDGKEIAKIKTNYYYYIGKNYISSSTDAFKSIFLDYNESEETYVGANYWLASNYCLTDASYMSIGMRFVGDGKVNCDAFFTSYGAARSPVRGIRAVVTISSEVAYNDLTDI